MITNLQHAKICTLLRRELLRVGTALRAVRSLERVPVLARAGRHGAAFLPPTNFAP